MMDNSAMVRMLCPFVKSACFMADLRECSVVNQYFKNHKGHWTPASASALYREEMRLKSIAGGIKGGYAKRMAK